MEFLWSSFGDITYDTQTYQVHKKKKAKEHLKTCFASLERKLLITVSLKLPISNVCSYNNVQTQLYVCVYYQQSVVLAGGSFRHVSSGQLAFWHTLCFVAQAPVKYQISGKETEREKYEFLGYHDSLLYKKAVLLEFPG